MEMIGECDRCKRDVGKLQELTFKSKVKETTLHLCDECMAGARWLFMIFLQSREI